MSQDGLPEADAATRRAVLDWLDRFAGFVREVDYAAARPMIHDHVLAFGTHRDVIAGLESWVRSQWDNVWPRTADFRFDVAATRVLASADGGMAVAVAPWTSTGYGRDGAPFDRPGRATMVFVREGGRWLCVHSHMSLNRGVPQESFGARPVKA
ncbi:MAG TPA: nuclear transport factor 2 family protein [Acetobacteraceae bacterium]|nr:nuclear transport factor 2 family protein [Acetobacteraceae bacterium]